MKHFIVLLALLSFGLSGCATVNRGITDYFRIDSVPQGAKATTSIETSDSKRARKKNKNLAPVYHSCQPTPCAIALHRRSKFVITLEQDGYETAEMFITNSSSAGSYTANMAATTVTTTTTASAIVAGAAANAAITSSVASATGTILGGTIGGYASIFSFGLIPIETGVSTGAALLSSSTPAVSSTVTASSAIPPALIVTGGMLLTDVATGANVNLYPNPVVLKMAPKGSAIKTDPNVERYRREKALEDTISKLCPRSQGCKEAIAELKELQAKEKAARKAAIERIKLARKAERKNKPR